MKAKHGDNYKLSPIVIGPRRYGSYSNEFSYDYLIALPESKVEDFLSLFTNEYIISYSGDNKMLAYYPIHVDYRIRGTVTGFISSIIDAPIGSKYVIYIISHPDHIDSSNFILENTNLYQSINIRHGDTEFAYRLEKLLMYAKSHDIIGGAFPDELCYIIYTMNSIQKGYSIDKMMKMIHQKRLYYHSEYMYKHISYVSDKSFDHMRHKISGIAPSFKYKYQILSPHLDDILRLSKELIDNDHIVCIENDGTIYTSKESYDIITGWIQSRGFNATIICDIS